MAWHRSTVYVSYDLLPQPFNLSLLPRRLFTKLAPSLNLLRYHETFVALMQTFNTDQVARDVENAAADFQHRSGRPRLRKCRCRLSTQTRSPAKSKMPLQTFNTDQVARDVENAASALLEFVVNFNMRVTSVACCGTSGASWRMSPIGPPAPVES